MTPLTLRETLDILDGKATLSPCVGRFLTPRQLTDKLSKDLPEFLEASVRLTLDRVSYIAQNGQSVGGWAIHWTGEERAPG